VPAGLARKVYAMPTAERPRRSQSIGVTSPTSLGVEGLLSTTKELLAWLVRKVHLVEEHPLGDLDLIEPARGSCGWWTHGIDGGARGRPATAEILDLLISSSGRKLARSPGERHPTNRLAKPDKWDRHDCAGDSRVRPNVLAVLTIGPRDESEHVRGEVRVVPDTAQNWATVWRQGRDLHQLPT
jgi:hypothetical protein